MNDTLPQEPEVASSGESPSILCLAGFGDDASTFAALLSTRVATKWHLLPIDLPGFGAERSQSEPMIDRYRKVVAKADPVALWQLGTDARRFSDESVPGEVLASSARTTYIYDPSNCPEATRAWLGENDMDRIVLEGASHWVSVDDPELLSDAMLRALL